MQCLRKLSFLPDSILLLILVGRKKVISETVAVSQSQVSEEYILTSKKPVCFIAENCAWLLLSNKTSFNLHVPKETRFVEGLGGKIPSFLRPPILYIL